MRRRRRRMDNQGLLLIGSYLVLSLFLAYSSAITLRTGVQRMVADQLHDRLQAMNLAQGAMEQLREDLYAPLSIKAGTTGNVIGALAWLDTVGLGTATNPTFTYTSASTPRQIALAAGSGQAWITSVTQQDPANAFSPRDVTIESMATVGDFTKRLRATYVVELGMSSVFRYAYFINNYGWVEQAGSQRIYINGDIRANGDLDFTGNLGRIDLNGDGYASKNLDLGVNGLITGDPHEAHSWTDYWKSKPSTARPAEKLTEDNQPAIGGTQTILSNDQGWESDNPDQTMYPKQATQDIPYLGDLDLYRDLASDHNGGAGSTLTYYVANSNGSLSNTQATITASSSNGDPLILIGTSSKPIVINGPVVIPGDVIIRGYVTGSGTIYAGRNVHVIGELWYKEPPSWPRIERDASTGQLREKGKTSGPASNLGTVCSDGTYVTPTGTVPGGCI